MKQNIWTFFLEIINLKGDQNCCIGSKVKTILLNGWILHTSGVASGMVYAAGLFLGQIMNKHLGLQKANTQYIGYYVK